MFDELRLPISSIPILWGDNLSARALADNPVFHPRTKHIKINVFYVREFIVAKKLVVKFVPSKF